MVRAVILPALKPDSTPRRMPKHRGKECPESDS